nr:ribonuclease H-like domain-containing protein [Tanacetum cinerariifolium]
MPLTHYLTLFDMLVVPEYCVSLMSVHKVARDSKLVIAFDELKCYILNQDLKVGKVLGAGRQFDGLYYFDGNKGINNKDFFILDSSIDHSKIPYDDERSDPIPSSFEEAAKHQPWIDAMNSEMDAFYRNNTWDLVELPKGRKAIGSKWAWEIKYKLDGEMERYKARWWELDHSDWNTFQEWYAWFSSIGFSSKSKSLLEGTFFVAWWNIWRIRNRIIFEGVLLRRSE